ncbi:hypothetical protein ROE7235_03090 [Roseibaca ekhonensis]|jgi:hypothetical protein|uniref:Uncharacterized protein n=1 Tax=Roseinatronobacter ekhonensis TaxID=254356 RepID=A0A3B0MBS4_9RHOB|nr:hypothetical protein [Roseibaca ekhonensis]SUZ33321.1 hypothetical protein ROE7235_03090 [Roseibaca ekhonensis]
MARARPVLGYPSRSAACRALHDLGLSHAAIVLRFADAGEPITKAQVSGLLNYTQVSASAQLKVGRAVVERLGPAARARGITPAQLAERLLATVTQADLIDAVMDDQDEISNHKEV